MSSRPAAYFDALYAASPDPWNFAGSAYEHAKYKATLQSLGGRRFASGLEVGCSIGVLTAQLGKICYRLLALDASAAALVQARARCAAQPGIGFQQALIPENWPPGRYDLIVLSEILYFLSPDDIRQTARHAADACNGVVVLVNYLGTIDEPVNGDAAAELFMSASRLRRLHHLRTARYRLDICGL
jgi:SAM-dependent methyltransferase